MGWEENWAMKNRDGSKHPGPMSFMRVDAELAGFIVAAGFVVMGVVGLPIAKWFLLGAGLLGGGVALLLRLVRRFPPGPPSGSILSLNENFVDKEIPSDGAKRDKDEASQSSVVRLQSSGKTQERHGFSRISADFREALYPS